MWRSCSLLAARILGQPALRVKLAHRVPQVRGVPRAFRVYPGLKDRRERWGLKGLPAISVQKATQETLEPWDQPAPRERLAPQVLPGLKGRRERRGLKGLPAIPVQKATKETLEQ